jgi:hypothetical protein
VKQSTLVVLFAVFVFLIAVGATIAVNSVDDWHVAGEVIGKCDTLNIGSGVEYVLTIRRDDGRLTHAYVSEGTYGQYELGAHFER